MSSLTAIPERFAAGTTVEYTRSDSRYPANDGWTMSLVLLGPSKHTEAGVANGAAFDVALSAAETAVLAAGSYQWIERYTKAGKKYDGAAGSLVITPNLETALAGSLQSYEEKTLAVIEAALTGRLTKGMESYQIDGIAVAYMEPEKLEELRIKYSRAVARQRSGSGVGRAHKFAFRGK